MYTAIENKIELVPQTRYIDHTDSLFCSKEHYLQFKKSWKKYISDGNHIRSTYVDSNGGVCKNPSRLTSVQHLIYNALRNRDLHKSFSPITDCNKLQNIGQFNTVYFDTFKRFGQIDIHVQYEIKLPYLAFYTAVGMVGYAIEYDCTDKLLEPFNGTVTEDMLIKLHEKLKYMIL